MCSWRTPRSAWTRRGGSSSLERRSGSRRSCTPTSSPREVAPNWPRRSGRSAPTTWSVRPTTGIAAMAGAGVVAVSLPLATLYLNQRPMPARKFIDAGVPVAVATDFNPGSAPSWDLPLAMMLACHLQRMTPAEVLKGATSIAARAVGLAGRGGRGVGRLPSRSCGHRLPGRQPLALSLSPERVRPDCRCRPASAGRRRLGRILSLRGGSAGADEQSRTEVPCSTTTSPT